MDACRVHFNGVETLYVGLHQSIFDTIVDHFNDVVPAHPGQHRYALPQHDHLDHFDPSCVRVNRSQEQVHRKGNRVARKPRARQNRHAETMIEAQIKPEVLQSM